MTLEPAAQETDQAALYLESLDSRIEAVEKLRAATRSPDIMRGVHNAVEHLAVEWRQSMADNLGSLASAEAAPAADDQEGPDFKAQTSEAVSVLINNGGMIESDTTGVDSSTALMFQTSLPDDQWDAFQSELEDRGIITLERSEEDSDHVSRIELNRQTIVERAARGELDDGLLRQLAQHETKARKKQKLRSSIDVNAELSFTFKSPDQISYNKQWRTNEFVKLPSEIKLLMAVGQLRAPSFDCFKTREDRRGWILKILNKGRNDIKDRLIDEDIDQLVEVCQENGWMVMDSDTDEPKITSDGVHHLRGLKARPKPHAGRIAKK